MISAKKNNFIVEFRASTIRAARISSDTAPTVIEKVVEIDLSKEESPATIIREFSGAKPTGYLHASCSVYPQDRIVRQVLLDAQRGKEVEFVVDYLKNTVGVDPEAFSAYCLSTQDGGDIELSAYNKKDVLLCGTSKASVAEIQNRLVDSAIYPRRLELGTIGTIGVLKSEIGDDASRSPILFLEIDVDSTNAVIVGPKGVEMARRIDCGSTYIVQALKEEMNLKDESAAEKILKSQDFDLGPIAPKLLRKLLRELQSSIGFFEVQTGSSVSELYCLKDGRILPWLENSICDLLNMSPLRFDIGKWLEVNNITFQSDDCIQKLDSTWVSLFSLVMEFGKGREAS
ncbi:hypothetical protein VDG1235_2341 [Verrucomicrobiia bacterium DG1235]|nr:hypothetical protein VDG1235_2341 [Verrucomicrobiae bacterium DG1235]